MSWLKSMRAASAAAFVFFGVSGARAYCRTTTCDLSASCADEPDKCCRFDSNGCDRNGIPLAWPGDCVSYSVQQDGSETREITAVSLEKILNQAFGSWLETRCNSAALSLQASYLGTVECRQQEFGEETANANIWMFRDEAWPYGRPNSDSPGEVSSNQLAITTVSFNWKTGELYDADVEFNTAQLNFSTGDTNVTNDLLSIATHEAGHFLGLDHSSDYESTMTAGYVPGSVAARTLALDDENAICDMYPQGRPLAEEQTCEPRGGFSSSCTDSGGCGCKLSETKPFASAPAWSLLTLALIWMRRRQRAS